jgi:hypothetical protein
VPAGITLTPSGGLSITTAGTVLSGLDIDGDVMIDAANVTIRNSRINGKIEVFSGPALFERIEIAGPGTAEASGDKAIGWSDFTCDGCNVYGWGKAFYMNDNVTIKNSYVHDLAVSGDPGDGGSHNEAIFTQGGSNFTIINNRLDAGSDPNYSAAIALYGQQKPVQNVLVEDNLLNGGGYCLYAGDDSGQAPINARYIGNTFGDSFYSECGKFGAVTAYASGNGNKWIGNVLADGTNVLPG